MASVVTSPPAAGVEWLLLRSEESLREAYRHLGVNMNKHHSSNVMTVGWLEIENKADQQLSKQM